MAGSGTLAIEHALRARGIAPGLRRRFGFERWPSQAHAAALAAPARRGRGRRPARAPPPPIAARDIAPAAIAAARRNAAAAGVAADITFEAGDVRGLRPPHPTGALVTNPPYGQRLDGRDRRLRGPGRHPPALRRLAPGAAVRQPPAVPGVPPPPRHHPPACGTARIETRLLVYQPRA